MRSIEVDRTNSTITVHIFTFGDAGQKKTWSGIPYYVNYGLSNNNVNTINTDISIPRLSTIYNVFIRRLNRISELFLKSLIMQPFSNSIVGHYITALYIFIRSIIYRYCDINIFLTYTYGSTAFPRGKTILYCDETYYQANERAKHQGSSLKRGKTRIHSEDISLHKAKCLFSTIPATIQYFKDKGFLNTYSKSINMINVISDNSMKYFQANTNNAHYELLFIGRKKYERGIDILLEAYVKLLSLVDMPIKLNIVGFSQTEFPDIINLPGSINFYKYLNKSNKNENITYTNLLSSASLFVMPQRGTLLAGAMFEAMYYGTPVITTDVEGMNRFITNGVNGLLIKKADSIMFAEAIANILNDNDRLRRMSFNAIKSVENMTPKNAMKELLYAAYSKTSNRRMPNEWC